MNKLYFFRIYLMNIRNIDEKVGIEGSLVS